MPKPSLFRTVSLALVLFACGASGESAPAQLAALAVRGDRVVVEYGYRCGCGSHRFELTWDGVLSGSPPRAQLTLTHEETDETCDGYCDGSSALELAPIVALYRSTYADGDGRLRLTVTSRGGGSAPVELEYIVP